MSDCDLLPYSSQDAVAYNFPLNQWNVSAVRDFSEMFARAGTFAHERPVIFPPSWYVVSVFSPRLYLFVPFARRL